MGGVALTMAIGGICKEAKQNQNGSVSFCVATGDNNERGDYRIFYDVYIDARDQDMINAAFKFAGKKGHQVIVLGQLGVRNMQNQNGQQRQDSGRNYPLYFVSTILPNFTGGGKKKEDNGYQNPYGGFDPALQQGSYPQQNYQQPYQQQQVPQQGYQQPFPQQGYPQQQQPVPQQGYQQPFPQQGYPQQQQPQPVPQQPVQPQPQPVTPQQMQQAMQHPTMQQAMATFPDAQVVGVNNIPPDSEVPF